MPETSPSSVCPKCGRALPQADSRGLCPKCLLTSMFAGGTLASVLGATTSRPDLPRSFGHYELIAEVARGGMGVVYQARQPGVNRIVAVKVLVAGHFAAPDFVKRFRTEAEAVASLDHPNIVPVYEVGEHEGQPFFSMKFVEGGSLSDQIAHFKIRIPDREAAELLAKLARAVHYAHQRGILHRDIKPGNVLLDAEGEPHLTDFGLARLVEQESTLTNTTAMLGTPSYMSPEQARGDTRQLTTAVDVYGLGALFYELLAGRPPFVGDTTLEIVRKVLEVEPRRPSTLRPGLDRDLETICLKCLEKDPRHRYGSAEALAADLDRWRDHEPILARPCSALERLAKWIRRNRGGFTAIVVIALLLVAGTGISTWQAIRATQARNAEVKQRIAAEKAEARAVLSQRKAEEHSTRAEWLVYASKLILAQTDFESGNGALALHYLSECQEKLRGWEWRYLWNRINPKLTLTGHREPVSSLAFSADGHRLVTGSEDSTAIVWDAATGQPLLTLRAGRGDIYSVAFSKDGQRIITGAGVGGLGIRPGEAKVWDAATGEELLNLEGHQYPVWSVAFSPDDQRIVTAAAERGYSEGGEVKIWNAATGREILTLPYDENVRCVNFNLDGQRLVTGSAEHKVKVWDAATGEDLLTLRGHTFVVSSVAFSPDGQRIVSSSWDRTARVWDAVTGREIFVLKGHDSVVSSAVFSPDSQRIVTGSRDKTTRIWNAQTGREIFAIKGHSLKVRAVAFSPDGKRVATGSQDLTARIWDADRGQEISNFRGHSGAVHSVAFSPDGKRLVTGSRDNTARVWDTATRREVLRLNLNRRSAGLVISVAFSPDGGRIATGSQDKLLRVWDAASGEELLALEHANHVLSAVFSPDGKSIAAGVGWYGELRPGEVKVWDAVTGQLRFTLQHPQAAWSVAFSPDGQRIVAGNANGMVKVWDAEGGQEIFTLQGHKRGVGGVAFSPDGRRLVTASHDKTAKVWDAGTGQELFTLKGHTDYVRTVAFSPDGQRIVTGSEDRTVKLWEAATGQEAFGFKEHTDAIWAIAFSPDGAEIVSGSAGTTESVRVWSAGPTP